MVSYHWRGEFDNAEVNLLHAQGFDHAVLEDDWRGQVERHSLGWVCARAADGSLVGFVNVPWDGAVHAFLLDTLVAAELRRRGIGRRLVEVAISLASAAGCEWLHVDFEHKLGAFYLDDSCGFRPTAAGLIELRP